jgi:hypothetical protein
MLSIARRAGVAVLAFCCILIPARSPAQFSLGISLGVQVDLAPPPLPVYAQPPVPAPDYIWMPGYWAWGPGGYFWVPGAWVQAPEPGLLWTPGYWAWNDGCGCYSWTPGYWAPQVGFYGGIDYGAGYYGNGYVGGQWNNGVFAYNTAVTNVNVTIVHNTYVNRTVIVNNVTSSRVAYNGGSGGVAATPTATQLAVRNLRHVPPTTEQVQHIQTASQDRNLLSSVNHGAPPVTAVTHPFSAMNHPADFVPVRADDRAAASPHLKGGAGTSPMQTRTAPPQMHRPMPMHTAMPVPPPHRAPPVVATPHPHPTRTP